MNACNFYWGSHGCGLPPGHGPVHQCGVSDPEGPCCEYDESAPADQRVRHTVPANDDGDEDSYEWGEWGEWGPYHAGYWFDRRSGEHS